MNLDNLSEQIKAFYDNGNPTGGHLHATLDDYNISKEAILDDRAVYEHEASEVSQFCYFIERSSLEDRQAVYENRHTTYLAEKGALLLSPLFADTLDRVDHMWRTDLRRIERWASEMVGSGIDRETVLDRLYLYDDRFLTSAQWLTKRFTRYCRGDLPVVSDFTIFESGRLEDEDVRECIEVVEARYNQVFQLCDALIECVEVGLEDELVEKLEQWRNS